MHAYADNSLNKAFPCTLETLGKYSCLGQPPLIFCLLDVLSKNGTFDFVKRIGYVNKYYPMEEAGVAG